MHARALDYNSVYLYNALETYNSARRDTNLYHAAIAIGDPFFGRINDCAVLERLQVLEEQMPLSLTQAGIILNDNHFSAGNMLGILNRISLENSVGFANAISVFDGHRVIDRNLPGGFDSSADLGIDFLI